MSDILEIIRNTKELSAKERKSELIKAADKSAISRVFLHLGAPRSDNRALLRALCDLCAGERFRDTVSRNSAIHKDRVTALLLSDDAKTRKLAAEFIGKANPDLFFEELVSALCAEKTDFVKPSMLLALGNTDENKSAALKFLNGYNADAAEEKHREEQSLALKKAISSLRGEQEAEILPLPYGSVLTLDCPSAQITVDEVRKIGYDARKARFPYNTVLVHGVEKYRRIFAARSFYTASVFYNEYRSLSEVENALSSEKFSAFLHSLFGDKELPFRIELKCEKGCEPAQGRNKAAQDLAKAADCEKRGLLTSPSSYIFEIVVNATAKGVMLAVRPSKKLDDRFIYKRESIAASIHPAAAAACVAFIKEYTYADANVLDCFCGSGTMLFERARLPYKSLTGSDISQSAIIAAKNNERAAKTGARFFAKNAVSSFREKYDEVICNMPFGLRVGSHTENKALYRAFLNNLPSLLTERGRAFLFTNDKKLLAELLADKFTVAAKHNFSCGGLYPAMFIVETNRRSDA